MRTWPMHWKVIVAILGLMAPIADANAAASAALAYETIEPARIRLGESATIRVTSLDGYLNGPPLPTVPGLTPKSPSIGLEVVSGDAPNPYAWRNHKLSPPPMSTAAVPKGIQLKA